MRPDDGLRRTRQGGIPVVACENAVVPSETLGEPLSKVVGSGAIFCTTVADGSLDILSEHYPFLHVGDCSASGVLARLRGFEAEPEFDTLMARKIFTYNAASGIIAYQGAALGIESYPEAANQPAIERELDEFYWEVNAAISAEYGVELGAQETFAAFSKKKFQNRAIADTVARNATSPLRKLGAEERIIAPARLIQRRGGTAGPLIRTAAAALHYLGATEASAPGVLKGTCDLVPGEPLYREILQTFERALCAVSAFESNEKGDTIHEETRKLAAGHRAAGGVQENLHLIISVRFRVDNPIPPNGCSFVLSFCEPAVLNFETYCTLSEYTTIGESIGKDGIPTAKRNTVQFCFELFYPFTAPTIKLFCTCLLRQQ